MSPASALTPVQARRAASLFAALGDETRLRLVARMAAGGPESIARLRGSSALSRQAVAKHLTVLAGAGLARGQRRGRERIWQLDPQRLTDACDWLQSISRQWDDALTRLRNLVEG
jgi:DNA-binding transcriptional ArsR family regulator